ncbi:MAG: carboxypeptidase-like regulatory domain-containing protein, partial [Fimbriiglobus sp.]
MRLRAGILMAVVVGLAGCKNLDRTGKDDRTPPPPPRFGGGGKGFPASKPNPQHWLDGPDDSPSLDASDRSAPARTTADPRDLNYDARAAVKGTLAGFVDDPEGRKLRGVTIAIEPVTGPAPGKPLSIQTDDQGYFQIPGLKSGQTYILTVNTNRDGRSLGGQAYVRTPNVYIRLSLIEGVSMAGGGTVRP